MAFNLIIDFVGLCTFVSDGSGKAERMHVILVAPDQQDRMHEHHYPRVFYLAAYEETGASGFNSISLDEKVLNLEEFVPAEPSIDLRYMPHVPNLSRIIPGTPVWVKRSLLGANPKTLVGARITLAAGAGADKSKGPWGMPEIPDDRNVAYTVRWAIPNIDKTVLDWKLTGLNGHGGQKLAPLTPLADADTGDLQIRLKIVNVPFGELSAPIGSGKPPAYGTEAPHFGGHYLLFNFPNSFKKPIPLYLGTDGKEGGSGTAFSCMPARGETGP
jgi:hypothetical protein